MEEVSEDIDKANALTHAGGFRVALAALKSEHEKERAAGASLIGTICRNNARGQVQLLKEGGLETILECAKIEKDAAALTKMLGALGSVLLNQPAALAVFDRASGMAWLARVLRDEDISSRARGRATFVASMLMQDSNALKSIDSASVVPSVILAASCGLEWVLQGLLGYRTAAPKQFKELYWDAFLSLAPLVAESGDETVQNLFEEIKRDRDEIPVVDNAAHIPFMITTALRGQLHMLGYSNAEIDQMPIDVAHGLAGARANASGALVAEEIEEANDDDNDAPVLQIEMSRSEPSS